MIRISLKADQYRKDDNIILVKDLATGKIRDAQYLYVDGPCKSFYEVDPSVAKYRIVWLETNSQVYLNSSELCNQKYNKKILIHKKAIENNCYYNENKQYHNFHKVCSLVENGEVIERSLSFEILGPFKIIFSPDSEDYRVWIETDSEVKMINEVSNG